MSLYSIEREVDVREPVVVVAFDAWVDAGSASTKAAELVGEGGQVVARFDADALYDYRARRPTLRIRDGRPSEVAWPRLELLWRRLGGTDLLVLTGPEPDYRWPTLASDAVSLAKRLGVTQWITLGAIPAAVPHTRPVPVIGTESSAGLLRADVRPGPVGLLQVPSAAVSVLDLAVSAAGVPAVGYFAQVPHYVSGEYPAAAVALVHALEQHLDIELPAAVLELDARSMRSRLDTAAAVDESTRSYIERLETMVDDARQPAGNELISEIERFLRERGDRGDIVH